MSMGKRSSFEPVSVESETAGVALCVGKGPGTETEVQGTEQGTWCGVAVDVTTGATDERRVACDVMLMGRDDEDVEVEGRLD